jgi:micrococcal nuclease
MKIPGVFLCLLFSASALADCGQPESALVRVARVSDGDTLKLTDGRAVRVLGINAPEVTHGKTSGQPFGRESRLAAQAFVDASKGGVRLGFERETHDHYGRVLAHVYDDRGRSLAAAQLRAGMAVQIAVPPNTAQQRCLADIEQDARKKSPGLWQSNYWRPLAASSLRGDENEFRLVTGHIARVDINSAVWLEFEGKLVARVAKKDWPSFGYERDDWLRMNGKKVEVRGWLRAHRPKEPRQSTAFQQTKERRQFKPLVVQLRSPSSLRVIED